jgi:acyl-CoA thioesterase-1
MEKNEASARQRRDRAHNGYRAAKFVGALTFVLSCGLAARAFAQECPKSPNVFSSNGQWSVDLGVKTGRVRILAIGSSSTEGVGASQAIYSYPADLQATLESRFPTRDIAVVNAGIGGETASQTVKRLETALSAGGYDLVIWQVGTNDAVDDVDPDGFRAVLKEGLRAARGARMPLILIDPQYFPAAKHPNVYASFVEIVDAIGKERGVPVFSRYALMKAWNDQASDLLAAMLSKDSFHMSDRGYACWANLLADDITAHIPAVIATSKDAKTIAAPANAAPVSTP